MASFPLYNNLLKNLPDKDLTTKQKNDFLLKIENIDDNGHELVYVLIKFYEMENNIIIDTEKEFQYDIRNFPNNLKHILYKFLKIHTKTMKEESLLQENRI